MQSRPITHTASAMLTSVGPLSVAQTLPSEGLRYADPFVLLHHAGPQHIQASAEAHRIDPHPHRGFAPVTFVYQGSVLHRDSLGNESIVGPGEVQWIDAAQGIIHSEGPAPALQQEGGVLELVQLWVNVPRHAKMIAPSYQELGSNRIADVIEGGSRLRVVSGTVNGHSGPANTHSAVHTAMMWLEEGADFHWHVDSPTCLIYVLGGEVRVSNSGVEQAVHERSLVVFGAGDNVSLTASQQSRILLLAAEPLNEPMIAGGPFVMNSRAEIFQAFDDYQHGKMGSLIDT